MAGLVRTLPISVKQQEIEMRDTDITLETHYPEIYAAIRKWAARLILQKRGWSPQEMEFTFEGASRRRHLPAPDPRHGHPGTENRAGLRSWNKPIRKIATWATASA